MPEELVGKVTDYFGKIGVIAVQLSGTLRVGDRIPLKGHTTDFEETVDSIQIEHESVPEAGAGASVAI